MEFEYLKKDWGDGYVDEEWYSGIYKVVWYAPLAGSPFVHSRPGFFAAYFKPEGWKNWGNHVNASTPYYKTLDEAKAACARHAERLVHA